MAEVEIAAGVRVDLASGHELREQTEALAAKLDELAGAPLVVRVTGQLTVDAAGTVGGGADGPGSAVWRVPAGYSAQIHRLATSARGYTVLVPLTGGWIVWGINGPAVPGMMLPSGGTAIAPVVVTEGSDGLWLSNGDELRVIGAGLTAGVVVNFSLQIELLRGQQPGVLGAF